MNVYGWIQISNMLILQILPYKVNGSKIKGEILKLFNNFCRIAKEMCFMYSTVA